MDERQGVDVDVKEAVPETDGAERAGERTVNEASARIHTMRAGLRETIERLRGDIERLEPGEVRDRARAWVREHPGQATLLAAGVGMFIGGALTRALTPQPAPLSARARRRAQRLAGHVGKVARETGAHLVHDAVDVGQKLMDHVSRQGEKLPHRARRLGEDVVHRTEALAETLVQQAETVAKEGMDELLASVQTHKKRMNGALDPLFQALRVALAVTFFKKMTERFRREG